MKLGRGGGQLGKLDLGCIIVFQGVIFKRIKKVEGCRGVVDGIKGLLVLGYKS